MIFNNLLFQSVLYQWIKKKIFEKNKYIYDQYGKTNFINVVKIHMLIWPTDPPTCMSPVQESRMLSLTVSSTPDMSFLVWCSISCYTKTNNQHSHKVTHTTVLHIIIYCIEISVVFWQMIFLIISVLVTIMSPLSICL